jgi:hypothetical protein
VKAQDIYPLLRARYRSPGNGTGPAVGVGEKWVQIIEARSGASWSGNNGQCDFLAIGAWMSTGHVLIGHEVKVTVGDWRRELKRPEKSQHFRQFCHEWYLVAPWPLVRKAEDEADPELWGLMAAGPQRLEVVRPSPKLTPKPVPWSWSVGWMTDIQRRYERRGVTPVMPVDETECDVEIAPDPARPSLFEVMPG